MYLPQSLPFDWCRNVTKAETQLDTHPPPRSTNLVSLRKNLFMPREVNAHRFPCSKRDNVPLDRCMRLLLHVSCVHLHVHCAGTCANIHLYLCVKITVKVATHAGLYMLYVPDTETFAANSSHYRKRVFAKIRVFTCRAALLPVRVGG